MSIVGQDPICAMSIYRLPLYNSCIYFTYGHSGSWLTVYIMY